MRQRKTRKPSPGRPREKRPSNTKVETKKTTTTRKKTNQEIREEMIKKLENSKLK